MRWETGKPQSAQSGGVASGDLRDVLQAKGSPTDRGPTDAPSTLEACHTCLSL
jgi:hypothetical protein